MKPNTNLPASAVRRKVVCPDLPMLSRFSLRTSPSSFPWDLSHWPINTFKPWLWKHNPQITLPPTVHLSAAKPAGKSFFLTAQAFQLYNSPKLAFYTMFIVFHICTLFSIHHLNQLASTFITAFSIFLVFFFICLGCLDTLGSLLACILVTFFIAVMKYPKKQLWKRKFCFGSQFEGISCHDRDGMEA